MVIRFFVYDRNEFSNFFFKFVFFLKFVLGEFWEKKGKKNFNFFFFRNFFGINFKKNINLKEKLLGLFLLWVGGLMVIFFICGFWGLYFRLVIFFGYILLD